ncbi:nucleotidyltransferase domain-containing protein [Candidatus Gracilibacteria bacterium]|nr:nucleotidyltransferase domain-containing protein [Candidatus Gracilibacteria bacterium]NJS41740.1 nucleotidyltransferase domain-containing protein [Candidatus Gracilibacteria bacterium]
MLKTDPIKLGIEQNYFEDIIRIVHSYPEIKQLVVFGSRVRGDFGRYSDIDLCVTKKNDGFKITKFRMDLEDLNIPYLIDVVDNSEAEEELREKIAKEGCIIWEFSGG